MSIQRRNSELVDLLRPDFVGNDGTASPTFGGLTTLTGGLVMPYVSEVTLNAAGAITIGAGCFYGVDTFGGAAADDLESIAGGTDGQILILRSVSNVRDVTVKDVDPLRLAGDFILTTTRDRIVLHLYAGLWYELSRSDNA